MPTAIGKLVGNYPSCACFFNEPRFMGALDTTNEGNNAHLRYQALGSRNVNVWVEEDMTHDSETSHVVEAISYDDDQRYTYRRYDAYGL